MSRTTPPPLVERFAALVASGLTVRAAALKSGIPERTARRLAAGDGFKQRVRALEAEIRGRLIASLSRAALHGAGRLDKILTDPETDPETAVKAFAVAAGRLIDLDAHFAAGRGAAPDAPRLVIPGFDPRWQDRPEPEPEPEGGAPPCPTTPG